MNVFHAIWGFNLHLARYVYSHQFAYGTIMWNVNFFKQQCSLMLRKFCSSLILLQKPPANEGTYADAPNDPTRPTWQNGEICKFPTNFLNNCPFNNIHCVLLVPFATLGNYFPCGIGKWQMIDEVLHFEVTLGDQNVRMADGSFSGHKLKCAYIAAITDPMERGRVENLYKTNSKTNTWKK